MKYVYNFAKDTYNLKGLTVEHIAAIATLVNHVRLGDNQPFSDELVALAELIDEIQFGDDNLSELLEEVYLSAVPSENNDDVEVAIHSPTLELKLM